MNPTARQTAQLLPSGSAINSLWLDYLTMGSARICSTQCRLWLLLNRFGLNMLFSGEATGLVPETSRRVNMKRDRMPKLRERSPDVIILAAGHTLFAWLKPTC